MKYIFQLIFIITIVLSVSSCLSYKDIVNFQDGQDLGDGRLDSIANFSKWTIQPEDIIQINVFSSNQVAAEQFNIIDVRSLAQMQRQGSGAATIMEPLGYRVDSDGYIDMPVIGRLFVKGKTVEEVKREAERRIIATQYLRDVNVQVVYMSFRLTILGEVNAPGSYIIQSQKVNILEALGLAKDLNMFANRDNLLVIRDKNNIREYGRLNLKSKDVFQSPYFYLQPGDIIYVEPHKARVLSTPDPATRYTSTIVGIMSLITLVLAIAK